MNDFNDACKTCARFQDLARKLVHEVQSDEKKKVGAGHRPQVFQAYGNIISELAELNADERNAILQSLKRGLFSVKVSNTSTAEDSNRDESEDI